MEKVLLPLTTANLSGARSTPQSANDLRKAAEGFETIFVAELIKAGRSQTFGGDILGSDAVDQSRDMLDAEMSKISAGRAGLGIADAIERQFAPFVAGKD